MRFHGFLLCRFQDRYHWHFGPSSRSWIWMDELTFKVPRDFPKSRQPSWMTSCDPIELHMVVDTQWNYEGNMSHDIFIIVHADGLTPLGAWASADTKTVASKLNCMWDIGQYFHATLFMCFLAGFMFLRYSLPMSSSLMKWRSVAVIIHWFLATCSTRVLRQECFMKWCHATRITVISDVLLVKK